RPLARPSRSRSPRLLRGRGLPFHRPERCVDVGWEPGRAAVNAGGDGAPVPPHEAQVSAAGEAEGLPATAERLSEDGADIAGGDAEEGAGHLRRLPPDGGALVADLGPAARDGLLVGQGEDRKSTRLN